MGNVDFNKRFEDKGFKIISVIVIVVILTILIAFALVTIPKINSGEHVKVFGLEYNIPKDHPDTINRTITVFKNVPTTKTGINAKSSMIYHRGIKISTAKDSIKPLIKYNITAPVTQSAVGDGASVTNNNYEPKQRILSRDEAQSIFNSVIDLVAKNKGWNTSTKLIYTIAVQDGEAFKFADQIAGFLNANGFTNWDVRYAIFTGIRTSNFEVVKGSENNTDFIQVSVFSQKSVDKQ